jgi:hypothetical protein
MTNAWAQCLWSERAIEKLKRHNSPGIDQIPAELIKGRSSTIRSEIHKLILFGIRRNCLCSGRSLSLHVLTLSVRAEYMYSVASRTSCPDGVLVLCNFYKVVKWPGMVDFKVYMATGLKVLIRRVIKPRHITLSTMYKILSNTLLSKLMPYAEVGDNVTGQLLIIKSVIVKYLRKSGNTRRQCISYL